MTEASADNWTATYTRAVAAKVRRLRKQRGMSAQNLSDACADLGAPIHRSVLANWENGRRANLEVTELLVLARALGIPPFELLFPADEPGETAEMLPDQHLDRAGALSWFNGSPAASAIDAACFDLTQAVEAVQRAQAALLAAAGSAKPATTRPQPRRRAQAVEHAAVMDEAFAELEQIADAGRGI